MAHNFDDLPLELQQKVLSYIIDAKFKLGLQKVSSSFSKLVDSRPAWASQETLEFSRLEDSNNIDINGCVVSRDNISKAIEVFFAHITVKKLCFRDRVYLVGPDLVTLSQQLNKCGNPKFKSIEFENYQPHDDSTKQLFLVLMPASLEKIEYIELDEAVFMCGEAKEMFWRLVASNKELNDFCYSDIFDQNSARLDPLLDKPMELLSLTTFLQHERLDKLCEKGLELNSWIPNLISAAPNLHQIDLLLREQDTGLATILVIIRTIINAIESRNHSALDHTDHVVQLTMDDWRIEISEVAWQLLKENICDEISCHQDEDDVCWCCLSKGDVTVLRLNFVGSYNSLRMLSHRHSQQRKCQHLDSDLISGAPNLYEIDLLLQLQDRGLATIIVIIRTIINAIESRNLSALDHTDNVVELTLREMDDLEIGEVAWELLKESICDKITCLPDEDDVYWCCLSKRDVTVVKLDFIDS